MTCTRVCGCSDDFTVCGGEQYPVQLQSPADGEPPNKNEHPSADNEITSQLREHTTRSCETKESAGSELKSRRVPGTLGLVGGQEKTCACPEEALYDQPVSLTRSTE